jgi:hypothetical protein
MASTEEPELQAVPPGPSSGRTIALVVGVAAIARGLYWVLATPKWVPDSDADQYLRLARAIAGGDGYSLVFPQLEMHATAFRPPLYPYVLAVPSLLFGDDVLWPSRLLSLLLGLGVVALTVVVARRFAGPIAGLVAGLCVALYPPLIANDTVTLTEPLALLLMLGLLLAIDERRVVWAGALCGLMLLTRPNAYLVVLIAAAAIWRSVGWRRALAVVGISVLVVLPWLVRNQVQVGTFRLTTSEGFNLAAIYAPAAQETRGFVDPVFHPSYDGTDFKVLQFDEAKWNSELSEYALDAIRANPGYVGSVVLRNAGAYWDLTPDRNAGPESIDGRNLTFRRAALPLYYLVTIAGCIGLWLSRRRAALWPAIAIVAQFVVLSLLLVAPPRLRAPFDLLMCIGVGLLAAWFVQRRQAAAEADGIPVGVVAEPDRATDSI